MGKIISVSRETKPDFYGSIIVSILYMDTAVSTKPTVLVVDDDEDMLIMMQHLLMAEGYVPLISPNAQNAMEIVHWRTPAMVLLDLRMIGVDGGRYLSADKIRSCYRIHPGHYSFSKP